MHGTFPVLPQPAALRAPPEVPSRRPLVGLALAAPAPAKVRECLECGGGIPAQAQASAEFCCDTCRKRWNNRRAVRGTELYDLVMIVRFDRPAAKLYAIWTLLSSIASAYRDADKVKRAGRRSWRRPQQVVDSFPMAYGRDGDGR
jgi:hypothetical protein